MAAETDKPQSVTVDNPEPLPVVVAPAHTSPQSATPENPPARATTTSEQDLRTAGQRRVNIIWEVTQAIIAISVTGAVIYSALKGRESTLIGNAFTLIIAIYFVRMNHTKIGGIGGTDSR